jgi:hypothetical protein
MLFISVYPKHRRFCLQKRQYFQQGSPQGDRRRRPEGMPTSVPPRKPAPPPLPRDDLPRQKPITDDEPAPVRPQKWKHVLKRVFAVIGILLALSLAYVFLLIGEPGEDDQLAAETATQEETIRVPIAASQVAGDADINQLAANFGEPVLAMYGGDLSLQKATLFDTAFQGGYARRLTLVYAFSDGVLLTVESVRPTAAVSLLKGSGYRLNTDTLYSLAGMNAVRMDSDTHTSLVASGSDAAYAVLCPAAHAGEIDSIARLASLMQATTP